MVVVVQHYLFHGISSTCVCLEVRGGTIDTNNLLPCSRNIVKSVSFSYTLDHTSVSLWKG